MNTSKYKQPTILFDGDHFGRRQTVHGKMSYPSGGGLVESGTQRMYRVEAADEANLPTAVLFATHLLVQRMSAAGPNAVEVRVAGRTSRPIVVTTEDYFREKPEQLGALDIAAMNHTFGVQDLGEVRVRGEGNWDSENHQILSIGAAAWRAYEDAVTAMGGTATIEA